MVTSNSMSRRALYQRASVIQLAEQLVKGVSDHLTSPQFSYTNGNIECAVSGQLLQSLSLRENTLSISSVLTSLDRQFRAEFGSDKLEYPQITINKQAYRRTERNPSIL